jgi:Sporulation related domain.
VGSFEGKPNNDLLLTITHQGFAYKMIQFPKGNVQINKLLIGPYKSKKEVLAALSNVKQKIQKDAFIAEIR